MIDNRNRPISQTTLLPLRALVKYGLAQRTVEGFLVHDLHKSLIVDYIRSKYEPLHTFTKKVFRDIFRIAAHDSEPAGTTDRFAIESASANITRWCRVAAPDLIEDDDFASYMHLSIAYLCNRLWRQRFNSAGQSLVERGLDCLRLVGSNDRTWPDLRLYNGYFNSTSLDTQSGAIIHEAYSEIVARQADFTPAMLGMYAELASAGFRNKKWLNWSYVILAEFPRTEHFSKIEASQQKALMWELCRVSEKLDLLGEATRYFAQLSDIESDYDPVVSLDDAPEVWAMRVEAAEES